MSLKRLEERTRQAQPQSSGSTCSHCYATRIQIVQGPEWAHAVPCAHCFSSCEHCDGTGFVFKRNAIGSVTSQVCPVCSPIRERIRLFNNAQIPRRYANVTLSDFKHEHDKTRSLESVITHLRTRMRSFQPGDPGMGLSGGVGTGKTMLMASFLRYMTLERGIPGRFIEFSHLLSEIRAGYDAGRSEAEIIAHLVDLPILIIDELGKSMKTEWQSNILDELISRRYNRAVSTFFTTNFPFSKPDLESRSLARNDFKVTNLEERIGSRMYSRLLEMCDFFEVNAEDYRLRFNHERNQHR